MVDSTRRERACWDRWLRFWTEKLDKNWDVGREDGWILGEWFMLCLVKMIVESVSQINEGAVNS